MADEDMKTVESVPNPPRPCMLVGLSEEQSAACARALGPAHGMRVGSEEDACTLMATVRPFVVVVREHVTVSETRANLSDVVTGCGAELVTIADQADEEDLAARLLEALCVAELRRMDERSE